MALFRFIRFHVNFNPQKTIIHIQKIYFVVVLSKAQLIPGVIQVMENQQSETRW